MAKGEPAPFTGQLLTVEHALLLGQAEWRCRKEAAAELARAVGVLHIDVALAERMLEIEKERSSSREAALRRQFVWYREPVVVASVSVLLTAAAILAARYTVIEVR